jgi:hypothetical protein
VGSLYLPIHYSKALSLCLRRVARFHVALVCLVTLPRVLAGQADSARADTGAIGVRATFSVPPLELREPQLLRATWLGAHRTPPALRAAAWDSTVSAVLDSARNQRAAARRFMALYGTQLREEGPNEPGTPQPDRGVLGLSKKYADLALDGQVRFELRTDRLRNERCGPALLLDPNSGCRGGFKPPRLDNQVNVRSSGTLGRRVHVAVDYDTERDFSGNNNVQVYYEGLEDEIIRRIEVGTVTFLPPPSRFITAAIPANNFGVNAKFEVGPFQFQTLAATQKGSQVANRVYTVGQTTSLPLSAAPERERCRSQPRRDHRPGPHHRSRPELRPGTVAAPDPGRRLLSGSIGPLVRTLDEARPERLPGRELYHRGRDDCRKLPVGRQRPRFHR